MTYQLGFSLLQFQLNLFLLELQQLLLLGQQLLPYQLLLGQAVLVCSGSWLGCNFDCWRLWGGYRLWRGHLLRLERKQDYNRSEDDDFSYLSNNLSPIVHFE